MRMIPQEYQFMQHKRQNKIIELKYFYSTSSEIACTDDNNYSWR